MNDMWERLTRLLRDKFGVTDDDLDTDRTFEEIGFDSLAQIEFALTLQREFGVRVDERDLTVEQSLGEAMELLASKGVHA